MQHEDGYTFVNFKISAWQIGTNKKLVQNPQKFTFPVFGSFGILPNEPM